ncbi:MAG: aspartyl protease family protein [Candidatus Dadabacteria bacterium]|nr:aspartyl protease family protein [Candidatus Dadabacteria bacterium]
MKYQKDPIYGFTFRTPAKSLVLSNEIQISEPFDSSVKSNKPPKKTYNCIWDTGATVTVITKQIVDDLGLQPSGKAIIHVVGPSNIEQEHETNTYLVNLHLPPRVIIATKVVEASVKGGDVLIGMDVITLGDFAVTNHNNKTTWSYRLPSCDEIDFVKEIEAYNKKFKSPEQRRKDRNKRKAAKRKK